MIITKLDVREFAKKRVPADIRKKVLEAARAAGSSMNSQHWRFILVQDRNDIGRLAADSSTGGWVANADFAVIILTSPRVPGSAIDGGRVLQQMELAAWSFGVGSGLFTGFRLDQLRRDFRIPDELQVSAALGFGYPTSRIVGKKDRKPLDELVFSEVYGKRLEPHDLS